MPRSKKNYTKRRGSKFPNNRQKFKKSDKPDVDKKRRNYQFIKRSKDAEEAQRRQKHVEDRYKSKNTRLVEDSISEDEEQVNPFDMLIAGFQQNPTDKLQFKAIDSSEDELEDYDGEEEAMEDDGVDGIDEDEESEDGSEEMSLDEENTKTEQGSDEDVGDTVEEVLSGEDKESSSEEEDPEEPAEESEQEVHEEELDEETENIESLPTSTLTIDPFAVHLENDISPDHFESLIATPPNSQKLHLQWPTLGNLQIEISTTKKDSTKKLEKPKTLLDSEEKFATEGSPPARLNCKLLDLNQCAVKTQLQANFLQSNWENSPNQPMTPLQGELFSIMNNYQDLFYPNRTFTNGEEIRLLYSLHALNHTLKTRTKILHHNAKISAAANGKKEVAIVPDAYRDQGFVRPKVLIVLPFKESAFRVVNLFVKLLFGEKEENAKTNGSIINYKRFEEEFTGETIRFPQRNPKPEDYEKTFAGNTDDTFRIGISFTKKCIKLFTEFYSSDILLVSPLGLRMIVGAVGEAERDYDFLASVELLILDQAELFLAQNWDHLLHVLDHLHLQPQSVRSTDFSRVRSWSLNGWSRFYRQTLLFTSHELPEFRSLFNSRCANYRGKVRVANPILDGSIRHVITQIPQVFHKIEVTSIESSFDVRFKYFINEILPQYTAPSMAHCMVYVPSYFDYVRLRNHFKAESMNFVQICEYTKDGKIARARDMFFHSGAHFLLYSERAHFFRRTRIKGIRHLIMYQPPCWPNFYSELINLMQDGNQNPRDGLESSMTVTILYTKYDMLQVSAIIGTDRAAKMFQSTKTTHMFMSGD